MKTCNKYPLMSAIGLLILVGGSASAEQASLSSYTTHVYPDTLMIEPTADKAFDASVEIIIKGPGDLIVRQSHPAGSLIELDSSSLPDGTYNFEVRAAGTDQVRSRSEAGAASPVSEFEAHSGVFTIRNGEFASPDAVEPPSSAYITEKDSAASTQAASGGSELLDQVITDDLIVQPSLCVGFDCVNGESFGADTIRLKENNLRIHFDDTSTSGSFPSNDWRIVANDQANGGANKFSIDDATAGRTPFTIEAGARNNALYVDDSGRMGFGTSAPVVEMHSVDGDTPTLRLEQDGSSGFTPQTWDVAGNETNFFVRDITNGSKLPFKIFPNSPSNSLTVKEGNVGIGTTSPDANLSIVDNNADIRIDSSSGNNSGRTLARFVNNGFISVAMENTGRETWKLAAQEGRFSLNSLNLSGAINAQFFTNGNLTLAGTLTENSSRFVKHDISPVNGSELLSKISNLEISEWRYDNNPSARHVGPMAEDWHELFGFGETNKGIAPRDLAAVALAAAKSLAEENRGLREEFQAENDALRKRIQRLEALISSELAN